MKEKKKHLHRSYRLETPRFHLTRDSSTSYSPTRYPRMALDRCPEKHQQCSREGGQSPPSTTRPIRPWCGASSSGRPDSRAGQVASPRCPAGTAPCFFASSIRARCAPDGRTGPGQRRTAASSAERACSCPVHRTAPRPSLSPRGRCYCRR